MATVYISQETMVKVYCKELKLACSMQPVKPLRGKVEERKSRPQLVMINHGTEVVTKEHW